MEEEEEGGEEGAWVGTATGDGAKPRSLCLALGAGGLGATSGLSVPFRPPKRFIRPQKSPPLASGHRWPQQGQGSPEVLRDPS